MDALAAMRRYAFGFVNGHDFDVCREIMTPDYTLHYGPELVQGRDENYIPAVRHQMNQFPQLGYAIHDMITDEEWTAVCFSEHGASAKDPGRSAAWLGVGLYRFDGERLAEAWVEQDHYGRRRQLESDAPVQLEPVAVDPWTAARQPATDGVAEVVASWWAGLSAWPPSGAGIEVDPGEHGGDQPVLTELRAQLDQLVLSGDRAAFHVTLSGRYGGGLPGFEGDGRVVEHWVAGFAEVTDGAITGARLVSHRLGVQRQLRRPAELG